MSFESELGKCNQCVDGYYLGEDGKCTNVKHCVRSYEYECLECEDKFYYNRENKTWQISTSPSKWPISMTIKFLGVKKW